MDNDSRFSDSEEIDRGALLAGLRAILREQREFNHLLAALIAQVDGVEHRLDKHLANVSRLSWPMETAT
jgi:hypothetical protein